MTTYDDPPQDAIAILQEVLNETPEHKPLVDAGVTIALRFATAAENKDGSITFPLKLHGARAYAIARIRSYKDRTEGMTDAKIDVDSGWWREAEREERKALLDHECTHFEVKVSDDGGVEKDDFNRTKLKMRQHDFQFGWFLSVARRHGAPSIECQQMARMVEDAGQWLLPLADSPALASLRAAAPSAAPMDGTVTISGGGIPPLTVTHVEFAKAAQAIGAAAARQKAN